jgi:ADP-ribosylation factor-binding protein GGA
MFLEYLFIKKKHGHVEPMFQGCKVRLLSPSGTRLPAYNPFLPPPALTQLMLVARPGAARVSLRFVLTYTCDGEACSDMGEVPLLPLDGLHC